VPVLVERGSMAGRAQLSAKHYSEGQSRNAYRVRRDIGAGLGKAKQPGNNGPCSRCQSLLELKGTFASMVHQGRELRRRKRAYAKRKETPYYDCKEQNELLIKSVFDPMGNYVYHWDCVMTVFKIGSARLARLRKIVQEKKSGTVTVQKESVPKVSDIVLPMDCSLTEAAWLDKQPAGSDIVCRSHPERHGNACRKSNNAKSSAIVQKFLDFVDSNSESNGRKEGSHGPTYFFSPKFTML
jgi:hypothetical protein